MTATTKWTVVLLPLALLLGVSGIAQREGGRPGPPMMRPKNVRVLKGETPQQLMSTMRVIAASLGVRCDFCHVQGAFDRDDKPEKRTARAMLIMTRNLNARERILDHKATCYMCHHGHAMPETAAPSGFGGAAGPGGTRRPEGPERERGDRD